MAQDQYKSHYLRLSPMCQKRESFRTQPGRKQGYSVGVYDKITADVRNTRACSPLLTMTERKVSILSPICLPSLWELMIAPWIWLTECTDARTSWICRRPSEKKQLNTSEPLWFLVQGTGRKARTNSSVSVPGLIGSCLTDKRDKAIGHQLMTKIRLCRIL